MPGAVRHILTLYTQAIKVIERGLKKGTVHYPCNVLALMAHATFRCFFHNFNMVLS